MEKVFNLSKRIRAVAGGTSASKTISILVWCIDYCQSVKAGDELVSIVSESYPHIERGVMADFKKLMKDRKYWNESRWNETKHRYTFETGNVIEFFSVDTDEKAHGPRRDVLFLNECNNLEWEIVDQLITRTRKIVWMDWNPTNEFYFYTEMLPHRNDIDFITLTYKDNEALDPITIQEIESHKHNANWWKVYGLGQLGSVEGRIYKDWRVIDEIPHEARFECMGLDFGYTNDPTAIVALYRYNGGFILDEIAYRKGMSNKFIADLLLGLEIQGVVFADSAEPKSIDDISGFGVSIVGVKKGSGSVKQGIQFIQNQRISVTKRSLNILKEYRAYMWRKVKPGQDPNIPEGGLDHALDAIRYGMSSFNEVSEHVVSSPSTYEHIHDPI